MSEILFRGKRIDNGEWVYGNHLFDDVSGKHYIIPFGNITESEKVGQDGCCYCVGFEVIPETVGQYTGLTDKNGKKIFKGDICRDNHNIYWIVWNMHGWQCKTIGGKFVLTLGCRFPLWQWDNCKENGYRSLEVTGNIHDNPELLNKEGE